MAGLILVPASIHEAIQLGVAHLPFEKFKTLFALVFAEVREELLGRLATDALATRLRVTCGLAPSLRQVASPHRVRCTCIVTLHHIDIHRAWG